jgi:hypothetical protein
MEITDGGQGRKGILRLQAVLRQAEEPVRPDNIYIYLYIYIHI